MPKTLNKNNILNFNFDALFVAKAFIVGCIWISTGATAFIKDNQFPFIVMVFLSVLFTNKFFFEKDKK